MTATTPARTTAWVLAAVSVLTLATVTSVAVAAVLRDVSSPASRPSHAGWQLVEGDGASYRVPPGWARRLAGEPVSYRDDTGRPQASGAALSTYDGGACSTDGGHPGAWAVLAEPVRARDVAGVAVAAARQWARGFGTGRRGTGRVSEPRVRRVELATGGAAAVATVRLDLRGVDTPCRQTTPELTVVAAPDGRRVRMLVVARYPGAVPDEEYAGLVRSLAP